ncbi:putative mitochondrial chaperone protein DNAj [Leptomonas pyrrhocoris]|uniref:Putative mitochondrial chaperone protein DNAj n=1 Tax=Leptomonas pyrrhocoris TaxID=157538 RepID=A0A0M9G120_LEPPY|nr:putative mitochondrial chaperone protein DNAj [Leptomonas pyrrhocoris]KPA80165.1 putative mitochondrial chaperone protein DNAj [Leptomonas pyrrhocoris]|eukprot:XP_015658604.1 putative mitochondrial chaperone protein DNAj [Leptomonas pyrrhocoris]
MNAMNDTEIVQYVLRNKSNFYKILMVEQLATSDQIKIAYKKMALKCHPDKNKHPQAAEAFKLVGSANATLSDATKRRIYDRHGEAGVQRHESGGGRRPANGAAGGPYRRRPPGQRDFFEEFFFGPAQARAGPPGHNGNYYQADINVNPHMLLLIPIILFVIMAMLLSSTFTDTDASSAMFGASGAGGRGKSGVSSAAFSFTPSPDEGIVVPRTTSLYGLRVQFYTTRRMSEMMDRRRDIYLSMEKKVLEGQRDYLGRRCEAEAFKFRSRGRKEDPPVCGEYQQFRRALG